MRKPPVRHVVQTHKRNGKVIKHYNRGKGRPKRTSRVVQSEETPVSIHRLNAIIRKLENYKDPAFKLWTSMTPDLRNNYNIDVDNTAIKRARLYRSGAIAVRPGRISFHVPIHRSNFKAWKKMMLDAGCRSVIWHEVFRNKEVLLDVLFAHAYCEYPDIDRALRRGLTLT